MLIDFGTSISVFIYDGTNVATTQWGGYSSGPVPPVTFPAALDPSGAVATVSYVDVSRWSAYGGIDVQRPNVSIYSTSAQASAALTALIGSDPTQTYFVGYPTPNAYPRKFSYPTRAANTVFQNNTGQDLQVSIPVDVSVTSILLATTQGTVSLQIADNAAFTTNVQTICSGTQAVGGVASITNIGTVMLTGLILAGKYWRILTANTAGTPTFTPRQGQEVLM